MPRLLRVRRLLCFLIAIEFINIIFLFLAVNKYHTLSLISCTLLGHMTTKCSLGYAHTPSHFQPCCPFLRNIPACHSKSNIHGVRFGAKTLKVQHLFWIIVNDDIFDFFEAGWKPWTGWVVGPGLITAGKILNTTMNKAVSVCVSRFLFVVKFAACHAAICLIKGLLSVSPPYRPWMIFAEVAELSWPHSNIFEQSHGRTHANGLANKFDLGRTLVKKLWQSRRARRPWFPNHAW